MKKSRHTQIARTSRLGEAGSADLLFNDPRLLVDGVGPGHVPCHVLIGDGGIRRVNEMECPHLTRKDIHGTGGDAGLAALGCRRWEKPRTIGKQVRATMLNFLTTYGYHALGNLVSVMQGSLSRSFLFDLPVATSRSRARPPSRSEVS